MLLLLPPHPLLHLRPQPLVVLPGVDDEQPEVGGRVEVLADGAVAAALVRAVAEHKVLAGDHVAVAEDLPACANKRKWLYRPASNEGYETWEAGDTKIEISWFMGLVTIRAFLTPLVWNSLVLFFVGLASLSVTEKQWCLLDLLVFDAGKKEVIYFSPYLIEDALRSVRD